MASGPERLLLQALDLDVDVGVRVVGTRDGNLSTTITKDQLPQWLSTSTLSVFWKFDSWAGEI